MDTVTESGEPAPDFTLRDLVGEVHKLSDELGRVVVLNFWSAVCPWSQRADQAIVELLKEWGGEVVYWPIASNSDETIEAIRETTTERRLPLVLHDADHRVADLYGAVATPQFFVIDSQGIIRYSGALDDVTFRKRMPTRAYVAEAVQAVLAGRLPEPARTAAYGCAVVRVKNIEG
jgi:peroxiredoxin